MARRYFTLEEANSLIPRVRVHMERALQLHVLLRGAVTDLSEEGIRASHEMLSGIEDPPEHDSDAALVLGRARALYVSLHGEVEAIEALGAELKGLEHGLVDFHSFMDGETEVLLCWKLGEARIDHYHLPDAGFAGRRTVHGHQFIAQRRTSPPRSAH